MLLGVGARSRARAAILVAAGLVAGCAPPFRNDARPGSGAGAPAGSAGSGATAGAGLTAGDDGRGGAAGTSDEPGTTGAAGAPAAGGVVRFHPPSQTFTGEIRVTLSSAGPTGEIRYTTDGQLPGPSSPVYSGIALRLAATTQVRAQLFAAGAPAGPATAGLYVARAIDPGLDLPIVVVDAYGDGPLGAQDRSFVDAAFMTFDRASGATSLAGLPSLASRAGIHVRGQSSSSFPKEPFRIELRDGHDADLDQPLLGMPPESDWVLHGPYPDKTLIRNAFVYTLGREMGLTTPRFAFVELYLNTAARPLIADDYLGVYLVVETIKIHKNRLDLQRLRPQDITAPAVTGGYVFKFELGAAQEPLLRCTGLPGACWESLELYDPNPPAPEQRGYITGAIQAFHDALHAPTFADPTIGYPPHIDVASFVDQLIVQELTRNMDAYVRSQYFHKDRGGRIVAGPLWDYDLSIDVGGSHQNRNVDGWQHAASAGRGINDWFQRLWTDPAFVDRVGARWKQLRSGPLSEAAIDARIASLTAGLANAAARNFQRWPILTTARVVFFNSPTHPTWQGQVENMRSWLRQRAAWIDAQFP